MACVYEYEGGGGVEGLRAEEKGRRREGSVVFEAACLGLSQMNTALLQKQRTKTTHMPSQET